MTQEPCFCLTIIPLFRSVVKGSVIHAIFLYYSEEITCKFHKKQRSVIKDANAKRPIHPCHTAAILSRETKKLCFTTLSLAMETMGIRLSVVKQSFFGPPGQYGRLVTRANAQQRALQVLSSLERDVIYVFFLLACYARHALNPRISCKLSWNLPFKKKMTRVWFLNLVEKRKKKTLSAS